MLEFTCKTCGGQNGAHYPSLLDADGVGDPGHKVNKIDAPLTEDDFPAYSHEDHKHEFTIPVAWEYVFDSGKKLRFDQTPIGKRVVKLMCVCGEEKTRHRKNVD